MAEFFLNIWAQILATGIFAAIMSFLGWRKGVQREKEKAELKIRAELAKFTEDSGPKWPRYISPRFVNSFAESGWEVAQIESSTWKLTWTGEEPIFGLEVGASLDPRGKSPWVITVPPSASERTLDLYPDSVIIIAGPGGKEPLPLTWIDPDGRKYLTEYLESRPE